MTAKRKGRQRRGNTYIYGETGEGGKEVEVRDCDEERVKRVEMEIELGRGMRGGK